MTKHSLQDDIETIAADIRQQASELRNTLFLSFAYTGDLLNRYLQIELDKHHSNRTNFDILHNLVTHNGSMTGTELAKGIFRSKFAVSRAVDVLEREGLVKREKAVIDRRETRIIITRKGVDFVKAHRKEGEEMGYQAMSVLNQSQAEELKIMLSSLRKHLLTLIKTGRQKK